jgi:FkbM family methyltransferase
MLVREQFSKQEVGHLLQRMYGRLGCIIPAGLKQTLRTYILPVLKKGMYNLLRDRGRILPLAAPLEGHQMRVSWPMNKPYVLGSHEPAVCKIIQKYVKPGYVVVDVGAHIGYFTLLFAKLVGEEGLVIAFEPLEETFAVLVENVALNGYRNVCLEKKAVSESSGVVLLYRDEWMAFPAASHVIPNTRSRLLAYPVSTLCLDEYVEAKGIKRVDFVKMDVEGAEGLVIKGMKKVIERDKPIIVVEVHGEADGSPSEALLLLERAGYQLWKLEGEGVAGRATVEYRGHVLAVPGNLEDNEFHTFRGEFS